MSWFYELPFGIACLIMIPVLVYLLYYIIKSKKNILKANNGKALMATLITIVIGGTYALFIKSVDTYKYLTIPTPVVNIILGIIISFMFATLIWGGIIVYREQPEKRKLLLTCFIVFIIVLIYLAFFFFIISKRKYC